MKLIDADAIIAALESFSDRAHGNQHFLDGIETAKELIAEADEAVVRCEDCEYADKEVYKNNEMWICRCEAYSHVVEAGDYCSRGERETNEAD